jgi:hypothetical protein
MLEVEGFSYKTLNFRKNIFAVHDFPKRTSNFVTIHPKTPLSLNFYVWASKLLEKILQPIIFQKNLKLQYNPPIDPRLFLKKAFNFPQINKTTKHI